MALDPICNWEVDPETAQWTSEHKGEKYYFCAPGCKQIFDQDPEKWTGGAQPYMGGGCSCCGGH